MIDPVHLLLATRLGEALQRTGLRLACAESCTGGGLAHALTAVPGSSRWFDRGFITYSNESKHELLGVSLDVLRDHGAVSGPVAQAMAEGTLKNSGGDLSVAITGVAGPGGGSAEKPVGTVWLAWCRRGGVTRSAQALFHGDRDSIRDQAVSLALQGLLDLVERQA